MVEQVSVARDSLSAERQQASGGPRRLTEIAGAGADGLGVDSAREARQRALAEAIAAAPVEAPNEVRLRVERDVDRVVAEVVDRETGEVVHEIPPEDMIAAAKKLEAMLGRVLDREA
jgi:flagellar protein FlaG